MAAQIIGLMEKVTAETVMEINWDLYLEVSDRLKKNMTDVKEVLVAFRKRLNHRDPHVVQNTIELLDFCWKNGPVEFRREICSKTFIKEIEAKAKSSESLISRKMCVKLKEWANDECKKDPSLSLVDTLFRDLYSSGYEFSGRDESSAVAEKRKKEALLREEEDRQLKEAIQASLKASNSSSKTKVETTPIYPTTLQVQTQKSSTSVEKKVRAVYDFPAAEDNEMSFNAGDVITVLDDSNPHWWRARLSGREGLIPAQFVEELKDDKEVNESSLPTVSAPVVRIDESVLLRAIDALQMCDPTGLKPDPEGLTQIESQALGQAPLIDAQLAHIDKLTNMLAKVDMSIRNALAEYDNAVQSTNYQPPPPSMISYPHPSQMTGHMSHPQMTGHPQPIYTQPQQGQQMPQIAPNQWPQQQGMGPSGQQIQYTTGHQQY